MECTAIVLAGGKSSRMGKNKALLPIFNRTNIENIVSCCQAVADEVIVVTNDFLPYQFLNVPLVEDRVKNCGPLAGLEAGLRAAKHEKCVLVACDMPFISEDIVEQLIKSLDDFEAVVPKIDGKLHPLFAGYRKSCLPFIEKRLQAKQYKMQLFFEDVSFKQLTERDFGMEEEHLQRVFFNMNRPEEFEKAKILENEMNCSH